MRLAQGHTTRKRQSQDLGPTLSDSKLCWPLAVNIEVYFLPIFLFYATGQKYSHVNIHGFSCFPDLAKESVRRAEGEEQTSAKGCSDWRNFLPVPLRKS